MSNAYSRNMVLETFEQAADLAGSQYLAVKITGDNTVNLAGAGEAICGVLQIDSVSGEVGAGVAVAVSGSCKAIYGATVAAGASLMVDAAGKLVTATGVVEVVGTAIQGGAADEVRTVMIEKRGIIAIT